MERPGDHPIPGRLNALLVGTVTGTMVSAMVYLGTSTRPGPGFFIATMAFALAFLCNYSLRHEACHDKLHRRAGMNRLRGTVSAMLFPISYSLIHETHRGHHARNRSDDEMFDLYYEGDNVLAKRLHWYALLLGGHYFAMVMASFAVLVLPAGLLKKFLLRNPTYGPSLDSMPGPRDVIPIRLEALAILGLLAVVISFLDVTRLLPAVCLGVFLWSTNQYLPHVFSSRDRVEGGFNLTGAGPLAWILLHRENDLTHHRQPNLPWVYLRSRRKPLDPKVNYYCQWLRRWTAPRLTHEHPPPPARASRKPRP